MVMSAVSVWSHLLHYYTDYYRSHFLCPWFVNIWCLHSSFFQLPKTNQLNFRLFFFSLFSLIFVNSAKNFWVFVFAVFLFTIAWILFSFEFCIVWSLKRGTLYLHHLIVISMNAKWFYNGFVFGLFVYFALAFAFDKKISLSIEHWGMKGRNIMSRTFSFLFPL